jgi:hypothetical protein
MGMNKYSSQSFEEMAAEQNDEQEVKNTPAEPKAETAESQDGVTAQVAEPAAETTEKTE